MPGPMSHARREEIRAALEPLPAYPWRWRGGRDLVSGDYAATTLITSGHGSALLFHAADPANGDSLLLAAQQFATEGLANVVGHWIEHSAQYAEELLVENQRLTDELDAEQAAGSRAGVREYVLLNEIRELQARLEGQTARAITAEHRAEGVGSALGRAKQDAGELEKLVAEAHETARLTADVVLFGIKDGVPHVLLIKRRWDPFEGRWALPGGHVDVGETTAAAAARELTEETGLSVAQLDYVGAYAEPKRDPRGRYVTFAYVGRVDGLPAPTAADDAAEAAWIPLREALRDEFLAFDHARIVADSRDLAL